MAAAGFVITAVWFLYQSAFDRERERLMGAVAKTVSKLAVTPGAPSARASWTRGTTVDIVVAEINGADGVLLHLGRDSAVAEAADEDVRLPMRSAAAEPFRRARTGETGTVISPDYRGRQALVAFSALPGRNVVVAASTPLRDIRASCIVPAAGIVLAGAALALVAAAAIRSRVRSLFRRMTEREAKVRSTVNNMRDAFFIVDRDWRITFANRRVEELFQRDIADLTGTRIWDQAPELASLFYRPLNNALRWQQFASIEGPYPPADKWFEVRANPNGDGLAITMIDITELRLQKERLHDAEARFRNLVEGSIQGIVVHQDQLIVYANEAYAQVHGYTVDELTGMSVVDLIWPEDLYLFRDYNKARSNGESETNRYQLRARCKDGSSKWIEAQARMIERNGLPATQATVIDISERKAAEDALHRHSKLAQLLKDIAISVNEAENVSEALQSALDRICAYMNWPVGHAFLVDAMDGRSLRSSGVWSVADEMRFADLCHACASATFMPGEAAPGRVLRDGRPYCDIEIGCDDSDPRYRFTREADLYAHSAYPVMAGGEVIGILEFFHDQASCSDDAVTRNMAVVGTQLGRILERDRAKWALEDSEHRFRNFAEVSSDWFWEMGPDLRFTYFSERFHELFGVPPESLYGLSPKDTLAPSDGNVVDADRDAEIARHFDDLENHRPFRDFEYVAARPGGGEIHIAVSGTPVFDKNGQFIGYRGTSADISERKQTENRIRTTLRHQEVINAVLSLSLEDAPLDRKLERALELIQSAEWLSVEPKGGVFLVDRETGDLELRAHRNLDDGIVDRCARIAFGQCLCGRAAMAQKIIHTPHVDATHEITFAGMDDHGHYTVPVVSRGQTLGVLLLYLPAGHDKDHSEITFLEAIATTLAGMIESERGEEERRHLEGLLLQSQKMEAIGTLAGGVAHDINNTLVPILGLTELIIEDTPEDDENRESLQIIHDSAERTRKLVDQILSFSRKDAPERTARDVNAIIVKSLSLLRSTVPAFIDIHTSLSEEPLVAQIDSTQIQQVILNLTTNALQAMDSFGTLTVATDGVMVGVEQVSRCPDLLPGPHVRITVADTGCGMDDGTMSRIFDPFYTTKDVGEGTGLGLSVVHGIVSSHNGGISVTSQPGEGTEFQVFIPLAADESTAEDTVKALAS